MLDPNRRLRSHKELQQAAIRRASTFAHFAQNEPFYLHRSIGTRLTAYEWAFADLLGTPTVHEIDICAWTGEIGQTLRIAASDSVRVLRVDVKIWEKSLLLEEGEAVESDTDPFTWMYTTRSTIPLKPGVWLEVVAYDLPGNKGQKFLVVK